MPLHPQKERTWDQGGFPSIPLIKQRYKAAGLFSWDNDRVEVLCRQIQCDPYELCAAAGVFARSKVDDYFEANKWPVYVAIHFRKIEEQLHQLKFMEEPQTGPGPEDIAMAQLITRGKDKTHTALDCVATEGCKATTESIKQG